MVLAKWRQSNNISYWWLIMVGNVNMTPPPPKKKSLPATNNFPKFQKVRTQISVPDHCGSLMLPHDSCHLFVPSHIQTLQKHLKQSTKKSHRGVSPCVHSQWRIYLFTKQHQCLSQTSSWTSLKQYEVTAKHRCVSTSIPGRHASSVLKCERTLQKDVVNQSQGHLGSQYTSIPEEEKQFN